MDYYFITGVSSGIGLSLVKTLLASERELMIHGCSRRDPEIHDARFQFHKIDLSSSEELASKVSSFFKLAEKEAKKVVLINNAGMLGDVAFVGDQQLSHYQHVFAVNCIAPMMLSEAFVQRFQEHAAEKIVCNISSGAANKDMEGWAAYCSSKSALDRFTTVCVKEQTHQVLPIHFYSVSPGVIDTAMQAEIRNAKKENFPSLDRFLDVYRDGNLVTAEVAASKIIRLLEEKGLRTSSFLSLRGL